MSLDFPTNPVNGQIYDNYYWDALNGVWRSSGVMTPKLPAGIIHPYAGANAPDGYLLCSGQEVAISTYPALYAALTSSGSTFPYGTNTNGSGGSGSTHFRIPDLRGDVIVGKTTSGTFQTLGSSGGSETHTLTIDQMPSHTHIQNSHNHTQDSHNHTQNAHTHLSVINLSLVNVRSAGSNTYNSDGAADKSGGIASTTATNIATTATNQPTTATNQNTGGGQAHNNLQPYIVLNYIIKT